jgi:hypothetical protein
LHLSQEALAALQAAAISGNFFHRVSSGTDLDFHKGLVDANRYRKLVARVRAKQTEFQLKRALVLK